MAFHKVFVKIMILNKIYFVCLEVIIIIRLTWYKEGSSVNPKTENLIFKSSLGGHDTDLGDDDLDNSS